MAKLLWDQVGSRKYETGVEQAAMYLLGADGTYGVGEAWNGLTAVNESPSGAETTPLYANNTKYVELQSNEDFGGTIEAYTYPDSFAECNGEKEIAPGIRASQQPRMPFGMVYKTMIGNDTEGIQHGYKLNIVYNAKVSPSEKSNATINDSPEAATMSWEFTTTPIGIEGFASSSHIIIDSTKIDKDKLAAIEAVLYGSAEADAKLMTPAELVTMMGEVTAG